MKPEQILHLLGHSVFNPDMQSLFSQLDIKERPSYTIRDQFGISINNVENKEKGIYFHFSTIPGYTHEYGPAKSTYTADKYELIFKEVSFELPRYPYPLPFGIIPGDSFETICKKIGAKPNTKSVYGEDEVVYLFLTSSLRIIIRLKNDNELVFVRIFPIELRELKSIELKKALRSQNKNITDKNNEAISQLRHRFPTIRWKTEMAEGDSNFSEKSIGAAEDAFSVFLENVMNAASKKNAAQVYNAVQKATRSFNKLNEKYEGLIETLEREEIVEFLETAIKLTGFEIKEGVDITEENREW